MAAQTRLSAVALCLLAACGGRTTDDDPPGDGGGLEAGARDASVVDVGPNDASPRDAAELDGAWPKDASPIDAHAPDAEPADSASADATPTDAGFYDAAAPDSGIVDAEAPEDVGFPDAGDFDAGASDASATDGSSPDLGPMDAGVADVGPSDADPAEAGGLDAGPDASMDAGPDSGLHPCAPPPGQLPVGRIAMVGDHWLDLRRPDPSALPTACETLSYHWSEPVYAELRSSGTLYYPLVGMIDEWTLDPPTVNGTLLTATAFSPCYTGGLPAMGLAFVDMDLVTGQVSISVNCQDGWVGACSNAAVDHNAVGVGTLDCNAPDAGSADAGQAPLDGGASCYYPTMRPPEGGYQVVTDFEMCQTFAPGCTQTCSTSSTQGDLLEIEGQLPLASVNAPASAWPRWQIVSVSPSPSSITMSVRAPACDSSPGFTSWGTITVDTTSGQVQADLVCTQNTPNGCATDPVRYHYVIQGSYVANLDAIGCWQGLVNTCQPGFCTSYGACGAPCLP